MAQFEELQQLWQQQPETVVTRHDAESLATDLRRFGRRQDMINLGKTLLLVIQAVFCALKLRHDPLKLIGFVLVDLCVVYFLVNEWRNQRAAARLNFAASSTDFLRTAIARLQALKNPFKGHEFYVLMGGFWLGGNLMMGAKNWIGRVVITALPFAIYYPSVYLRGKRWDHECGPLVERLKALVEAAEENRTWIQR
jgi:hypothetical protein